MRLSAGTGQQGRMAIRSTISSCSPVCFEKTASIRWCMLNSATRTTFVCKAVKCDLWPAPVSRRSTDARRLNTDCVTPAATNVTTWAVSRRVPSRESFTSSSTMETTSCTSSVSICATPAMRGQPGNRLGLSREEPSKIRSSVTPLTATDTLSFGNTTKNTRKQTKLPFNRFSLYNELMKQIRDIS